MWFQISQRFYFPSLYFVMIHAPASSPTGIYPLFSAIIRCGTLVLRVNFFYLPMTADLDSGIPVFGRDRCKFAFHHGTLHLAATIPIVVVSVKIILSSVSRFSSSQIKDPADMPDDFSSYRLGYNEHPWVPARSSFLPYSSQAPHRCSRRYCIPASRSYLFRHFLGFSIIAQSDGRSYVRFPAPRPVFVHLKEYEALCGSLQQWLHRSV